MKMVTSKTSATDVIAGLSMISGISLIIGSVGVMFGWPGFVCAIGVVILTIGWRM